MKYKETIPNMLNKIVKILDYLRYFLCPYIIIDGFLMIKDRKVINNNFGDDINIPILKELSGKRCVPDYYSTLDLTHASWVRINKLEVIDRNKFLDEHTLKNGKEIKALNQGAVPFFYVIKAKKK